MTLKSQFQSLLEPELLEGLLEYSIPVKLFRFASTSQAPTVDATLTSLGPYPAYFTLYEVLLDLWNKKGRDPKFSPNLVFFGKPEAGAAEAEGPPSLVANSYKPLMFLWLAMSVTGRQETLSLIAPPSLMMGAPDSRFVDSAGGLKALSKDDRYRMTLNDVFQLEQGKAIPEFHIFLYADLVDRITGPRPLSERDVYGRLTPYFPALEPGNLPSSAGLSTQLLVNQAARTEEALKQTKYLSELLVGLGGELQMPKLDGVKLLRWVWTETPTAWEGPAVLFFGTEATHERPYLRLFGIGNQKLTKVRVAGVLPIPDIPEPELLLNWNTDRNPDNRKEAVFMKLLLQPEDVEDEMPIYATLRIFADGTADLLVMPPKQKRLLDPYSDIQDAPDALTKCMSDLPYSGLMASLGQADVVFKIRLAREAPKITYEMLRDRLPYFLSVFQEIPALPDEQPLIMLRYKGVSNFYQEDRVFAYLTQLVSRQVAQGKTEEEEWTSKVADEFQIPEDEARNRVVTWIAQRNEYKLAVPDVKDYVLNKNPGVDIAVFAQHPIYNFHIYRAQGFYDYKVIVNLLGLLFGAPADRFPKKGAVATMAPAMAQAPPAPAPAAKSPQADGDGGDANVGDAQEEGAVFFPDDDDIPEFMRGAAAAGGAGGGAANENANNGGAVFFPNNDDVPEFMRGAVEAAAEPSPPAQPAAAAPPVVAAPPVAAPPPPAAAPLTEEERKAKEAFGKPDETKPIKLAQYYNNRLKLADPSLFDYKSEKKGYVTHCAANESRQPIVLDQEEYDEMRKVYENDIEVVEDLVIVEYPKDTLTAKKTKQPSKVANAEGKVDGVDYPSPENPEIITVVKYGSKAKRLNYYFCPRLFCARDRILVRYKDFKATTDREGKPKPAMTCPFCRGTVVEHEDMNKKDLAPNQVVLQRRLRPSSQSERNIFVGFLKRDKHPEGLALPCCYADPTDQFDPNDPEFARLGMKPPAVAAVPAGPPPVAQPIADALVGGPVLAQVPQGPQGAQPEVQPEAPAPPPQAPKPPTDLGGYQPNYYRVLTGVSTKYLVDERKIPLEIIPPKGDAVDDPKAGPQIGLLPDALDVYFEQQSKAEKFSRKLKGEISRTLVDNAHGFLRLAVDNTPGNRPKSLFSALAPYLAYSNSADAVKDFLELRMLPRIFLQLNGGNLVHEFFNKCDKKPQNSMREFVGKYVGVDGLTSANIPAIERLMNAYECFKDYLDDDSQRKDMRVFYQALSQPGALMTRGVLFMVLEVTVEREVLKVKDGRESRETEVKLAKVRCPAYPLSAGQQNADIAFIIHYTEIHRSVSRKQGVPDSIRLSNMGWEPLFYVEPSGIVGQRFRHKPTLLFQRSQEASWPTIVQKRVSEFFSQCGSVNRGPFTSQSKMDPNALITATELTTGVRIQVYGQIRDAYNHFVGVTYPTPSKSGYVAVPIADDGSIAFERRLHLDWDDFTPAAADDILKFYVTYIRGNFAQYRGYDIVQIATRKREGGGAAVPAEEKYAYVNLKRSRDLQKIVGIQLANGFVIPAQDMRDPTKIVDWLEERLTNLPADVSRPIQIRFSDIDEFEWDMNRTIAYDLKHRERAFADASEAVDVEDPMAEKSKEFLELKVSDIQEELEDVYQHLRLTFANWLGTKGSGKTLREALRDVLRRTDLPLFEKRKRLDILLEDKVIRWLEPSAEDEKTEMSFLRVDCLTTPADQCSGRCKWTDDEGGTCKIHTPATYKPDGVALSVPRLLYLRLVDELIRYASKREEIFNRAVPRLTIRQEAERKGDQYIIAEGTPDWNSWWEFLRAEWMTPEVETAKGFDEKYEPVPAGIALDDTRILPAVLRDLLGADDPKTAKLVWNPTTTPDQPYRFLQSVLGVKMIEGDVLRASQIKEISQTAKAPVLYLPQGVAMGRISTKYPGATEAIILATIDDVPGWVSLRGTYNVKLPLIAIPDALRKYGL